MTEDEWLTCSDPMLMLEYVRGKVDGRKLRLFAVACCLRVRPLLTPQSRSALAVAESFAEGHATVAERKTARASALAAGWVTEGQVKHARGPAKASVSDSLARRAFEAATRTARRSGQASAQFAANRLAQAMTPGKRFPSEVSSQLKAKEGLDQSHLVRDIFGNPFSTVVLNPSWLTPTVVPLAGAIYNERAFDRMPELADALEQAGCSDAGILGHCRGPGSHVRGCWVVDLILGKG